MKKLLLLLLCVPLMFSCGEKKDTNREIHKTKFYDSKYNPEDRQKSVYSKDAMLERKIETFYNNLQFIQKNLNNNKILNSYDYSVSGFGENGYVNGDVSVTKEGGDGYVYNEDGESLWIDVEWSGYGELEGWDENGDWYQLEVD